MARANNYLSNIVFLKDIYVAYMKKHVSPDMIMDNKNGRPYFVYNPGKKSDIIWCFPLTSAIYEDTKKYILIEHEGVRIAGVRAEGAIPIEKVHVNDVVIPIKMNNFSDKEKQLFICENKWFKKNKKRLATQINTIDYKEVRVEACDIEGMLDKEKKRLGNVISKVQKNINNLTDTINELKGIKNREDLLKIKQDSGNSIQLKDIYKNWKLFQNELEAERILWKNGEESQSLESLLETVEEYESKVAIYEVRLKKIEKESNRLAINWRKKESDEEPHNNIYSVLTNYDVKQGGLLEGNLNKSIVDVQNESLEIKEVPSIEKSSPEESQEVQGYSDLRNAKAKSPGKRNRSKNNNPRKKRKKRKSEKGVSQEQKKLPQDSSENNNTSEKESSFDTLNNVINQLEDYIKLEDCVICDKLEEINNVVDGLIDQTACAYSILIKEASDEAREKAGNLKEIGMQLIGRQKLIKIYKDRNELGGVKKQLMDISVTTVKLNEVLAINKIPVIYKVNDSIDSNDNSNISKFSSLDATYSNNLYLNPNIKKPVKNGITGHSGRRIV